MSADRAEAAFWAAFIRNRNVDVSSAEDGAVSVAGGYALFVRGTYTHTALAVGSTRALREDDLAVLHAFYGGRKHPVRIEVREETFERDRPLLEAAGYELSDAKTGLFETTAIPENGAAKVVAKPVSDRAAWVRLVTRAFAENGEPDEDSRRSATLSAAAAHGTFIAQVDGVAAGADAVTT